MQPGRRFSSRAARGRGRSRGGGGVVTSQIDLGRRRLCQPPPAAAARLHAASSLGAGIRDPGSRDQTVVGPGIREWYAQGCSRLMSRESNLTQL